MNKYIEANKKSWAQLAEEHYTAFKILLSKMDSTISDVQKIELGDITGKSLIHLQCNTGADTISLSRMGAKVTGIDLVPENIFYAQKLARDFGIKDAQFFAADVLEVLDVVQDQFDIVYTTEGVLCWLPDLTQWARNIRQLLKDDGFLYVLDGHPFYMVWDEEKLPDLVIKYPYFRKTADPDEWIGGYASEAKMARNYSWMYTMGEIVTALSEAGLHIEWLHEYDWLYYRNSPAKQVKGPSNGWLYPEHKDALPYTFSLKATIR